MCRGSAGRYQCHVFVMPGKRYDVGDVKSYREGCLSKDLFRRVEAGVGDKHILKHL